MSILTLLTDFGVDDYYVAAVKGVVLQAAPAATIVDVSHSLPPGDVEAAAFLLAAASRHFPPGTVHLSVVDPGVGGERRILAAATRGALFVAPDNGLLTPVLAGAAVRSVERPDLYLDLPGQTFHGRDRFAPVCGHLLQGHPVEGLGPPILDPVRLPWPEPRRDAGVLVGRVAHVDRFGNLVTDIPSAWLGPGSCEARVGRHRARHRASHYAQMPAATPAVLPGSLGTLELSIRGESLAHRWGIERGAAVEVRFG